MHEANDSKFVTRKWNIVNDNAKANYDVANDISYNTKDLKYNLCDYNDANILLRCNITIIRHRVIQVALKIVNHLLNVLQKLMKQQ